MRYHPGAMLVEVLDSTGWPVGLSRDALLAAAHGIEVGFEQVVFEASRARAQGRTLSEAAQHPDEFPLYTWLHEAVAKIAWLDVPGELVGLAEQAHRLDIETWREILVRAIGAIARIEEADPISRMMAEVIAYQLIRLDLHLTVAWSPGALEPVRHDPSDVDAIAEEQLQRLLALCQPGQEEQLLLRAAAQVSAAQPMLAVAEASAVGAYLEQECEGAHLRDRAARPWPPRLASGTLGPARATVKRARRTWSQIADRLRRLEHYAGLRVNKEVVDPPVEAGGVRTLALPVGQLIDWRLDLGADDVMHVREYDREYVCHLEPVHRCNGRPMPASHLEAGAALGALVGLVLAPARDAGTASAILGAIVGTVIEAAEVARRAPIPAATPVPGRLGSPSVAARSRVRPTD
jgi:hypothetical protein